jgi:integrase
VKIKGLYQKREFFYFQPPMVQGVRPKPIALRTKNLHEAIRMATELRQRLSFDQDPDRLSHAIKRYIGEKRALQEMTRGTLEHTERFLERFAAWAGDILIAELSRSHIENFRLHLNEKGLKASTIVCQMRRLQGFCSWLKAKDKILRSPFEGVKLPTIKRTQAITFCTREQRDHLIECCDREDLHFILMAGFFLGLRIGEIIEAVPSWFRTPGVVELTETAHFQPKDKERRLIHYGDRFAQFLASYGLREPFMVRPEVRHGRGRMRWHCERPWKALVDSTELPWVTPHVMRHTFATLHIQAGTPLATVARWLGDSYAVTFAHYAAYAPTDAHIRNLD